MSQKGVYNTMFANPCGYLYIFVRKLEFILKCSKNTTHTA